MANVQALVFLLLFKVIASSINITINHKRVQLNKTKQNSLAIMSQNRVMVGYQSGKIQIIDVQNNKLKKQYFYFQNAVDSIIVLDQKIVFVNDGNKVLMLDHSGQILRKWQGKQKNKGVIAAYNTTGIGYMSIIKKSIVQQRMFQNFTYVNNYLNFFDTGEHGVDLALYSPLHTHLYIVNNRKNKIIVYDITQITVFDPKGLDKALNDNSNQNSSNQSQAHKKSTNKNQASNREMQKRVLQVMNNNMKNIILQRNFNFKIKKIINDQKQAKIYNQVLLVISQQDTVYYTNKATILTFLPYKNHTSDQLISICFCQKLYFLILHKHHFSDQETIFYLSFFNKKTLIVQRILQLNRIFYDIKQIKSMDCNHKRITLLTNQSEILIIQNQYEEQIEQISNQQIITQIQLISTLIVIIIFTCFCKKNPEKSNQQKQKIQKQSSNQQQAQQANEALSKRQDLSQKKTSANSSQQEKMIQQKDKSNKDKLFHMNRHKKNKKKLK